jgi:hypothetical protein
MFREPKPGYFEIMSMIGELNPSHYTQVTHR